MEHVAEHGIGELSLRPLAEAVGTSHRMLLFHFGSKEQLMVAVVRAVEAQQRQALAELTERDDLTVIDQMQQSWTQLLDPALRNNIRLFYEVYADALRGRAHTGDFLDEVIASWLPPVTAALERAASRAGEDVSSGTAEADARLMLAVTRGLLLDLVTTDDIAGVDAAMQRFAALYAGAVTGLD